MVDELDKLKGLSPEERIKKLKELEEQRKKEIESAQKLIKQTEIEIEENSKEKQQLPIPQLKSDLATLTSEEEKDLFKMKRYEDGKKPSASEKKEKSSGPKPDGQSLEESVSHGIIPDQQKLEAHVQYQQLATQPIDQLKGRLEYLNQNQQQLSYEQRNEVSSLSYALQKKMEDIESGKYKPEDYSTVKEVQESLSMIKKIENAYKR